MLQQNAFLEVRRLCDTRFDILSLLRLQLSITTAKYVFLLSELLF